MSVSWQLPLWLKRCSVLWRRTRSGGCGASASTATAGGASTPTLLPVPLWDSLSFSLCLSPFQAAPFLPFLIFRLNRSLLSLDCRYFVLVDAEIHCYISPEVRSEYPFPLLLPTNEYLWCACDAWVVPLAAGSSCLWALLFANRAPSSRVYSWLRVCTHDRCLFTQTRSTRRTTRAARSTSRPTRANPSPSRRCVCSCCLRLCFVRVLASCQSVGYSSVSRCV